MPVRSSEIRGGVFLSMVPPSDREVKLARVITLASLAICLLVAPFAGIKLAEIWAFIPIYQSAVIVTDVVTAILLFAQFAILGSAALLLIAAGYLFSASMAVSHLLSFPRLFAAAGIIGGGAQTTAWLYMIWHSGLPLAVIAYALLREHKGIRERGTAVVVTCIAVAVIAAGATLLTTVGHDLLPAIMQGDQYTPLLPNIVSSVWLLGVLALFGTVEAASPFRARFMANGRARGAAVRHCTRSDAECRAFRYRILCRPHIWVDGFEPGADRYCWSKRERSTHDLHARLKLNAMIARANCARCRPS